MPTTEIFKKFGEKAFREKEKSVIESLKSTTIENHFSWRRGLFTRGYTEYLFNQLHCLLPGLILGILERENRLAY